MYSSASFSYIRGSYQVRYYINNLLSIQASTTITVDTNYVQYTELQLLLVMQTEGKTFTVYMYYDFVLLA